MKARHLFASLLTGLLSLAGCGKPAAAPPAAEIDPVYGHLLHAQPRLPALKLSVGGQETTAELARQKVEIATGMMFRTNLLENESMLFVFPDAAPRSFYMRNCFVPLSGAYLSPAGEILQIIDMKPHDETGIPSLSENIQFVLEAPEGWFARHHVGLGAIVRTERGSLRETFFGSNPPPANP